MNHSISLHTQIAMSGVSDLLHKSGLVTVALVARDAWTVAAPYVAVAWAKFCLATGIFWLVVIGFGILNRVAPHWDWDGSFPPPMNNTLKREAEKDPRVLSVLGALLTRPSTPAEAVVKTGFWSRKSVHVQ